MQGYMRGREFVPFEKVTRLSVADDDLGDWVFVGVIVGKSISRAAAAATPAGATSAAPASSVFGSATSRKYCVMRLGDLRGNVINAFLFDRTFDRHAGEAVGGVFAVLNPRILPCTERFGIVGLEIDHPDKFLRLGTSVDFAHCKAVADGQEKCSTVIDRRFGEYCSKHALANLKRSRARRQELVVGDAILSIRDQNGNRMNSETKPTPRGALYVIRPGVTVSVDDGKADAFVSGKPSAPAPLSKAM
ncbi:minichromosome maintenance- protein [Cladochytrium tenue]|nr:minichromosome maintenance- protein [Cladochytrium tenue]